MLWWSSWPTNTADGELVQAGLSGPGCDGQLHSSGAIAIDEFADTTARLTFVLRGDGIAGASMLVDNIRTWGFVSGALSGDGKLDGLDVQPFVNAIIGNSSDPGAIYLSDFDGDDAIGPQDIEGFVAAILGL